MTFYVYVLGPMSGTPAEYLANCHRLSATSRLLMDYGYCPINPAGDMLEGLMGGTPLTDEQYKARSMTCCGCSWESRRPSSSSAASIETAP